jgi:hypothetical protein
MYVSPRRLPQFRRGCRGTAFDVLNIIKARMNDPEVPFGDLVRAFKELSERGGFVTPMEEANLENAKARLVLTAMAMDLSADQRDKLLKAIDG